jgi:hypothetical protein
VDDPTQPNGHRVPANGRNQQKQTNKSGLVMLT